MHNYILPKVFNLVFSILRWVLHYPRSSIDTLPAILTVWSLPHCQVILRQHELLWWSIHHFGEGFCQAEAAGGGERGRHVCNSFWCVAGQRWSDGKAQPHVLRSGVASQSYGTLQVKDLHFVRHMSHLASLCFFLQAMLRCLPPVSFCVVTSLLPRMGKHRSNLSKVRLLCPHNTVDFKTSVCNIKINMQHFKIEFIFFFLESLKALADAICAHPNIHSR